MRLFRRREMPVRPDQVPVYEPTGLAGRCKHGEQMLNQCDQCDAENSSRWITPDPDRTDSSLSRHDVSADVWMPETVTNLNREEAMPDEPHDTEGARYGARPETLADAPPTGPARAACPHCRGTGNVLTTNDLLRESIELLGDEGDNVIREFYRRLLDEAPDLASLFPPDLLAARPTPNQAGEILLTRGPMQRDKLLGALVAVAQTFDPDRPDSEGMQVLDTHLATFGRSHAAFARPDGTVRGATLSEYHAVKVVLFGTLHDAAGDAWLPEYDDAWSEAYDYAAGGMLFHGMRSGFKSARFARP